MHALNSSLLNFLLKSEQRFSSESLTNGQSCNIIFFKSFSITESSTITSDEENEAEESAYGSLERFLTAWGLSQYVQKFKDEQIDLDALMLLTEGDMKSLGLPLGPYRKLVTAVQERKQALSHPGAIIDTPI